MNTRGNEIFYFLHNKTKSKFDSLFSKICLQKSYYFFLQKTDKKI